jgi:hypothetical protein
MSLSAIFGGLGAGLNLIGDVGGLLGAGRKQQEAEQARWNAMNAASQAMSKQEGDFQANNLRALGNMGGNLESALVSEGRGLGAANAQAGVYNPSAVAGTLANQGMANAGMLSSYAGRLGAQLGQLRSQDMMGLANMQYGAGQNDLNYARQQTAGTMAGVGGALASLPYFTGGAPSGIMPTGIDGAPPITDASQIVGPTGGMPGFNNPASPDFVNAVRSVTGQQTQGALTRMGAVDPATTMHPVGPGMGGTGFMMPNLNMGQPPLGASQNVLRPLPLYGQ